MYNSEMPSLQDNSTQTVQVVNPSPTCIFTAPNQFTLQLPASGYQPGRDEVALKSLTLYYSWYNVSAAKGNNSFQYFWPGNNSTNTVTIPDGIWTFADIRAYLQLQMATNGHYLADAAGNKVYYLDFTVNANQYCLSFQETPLPAALPSGWTNPASVNLTTAAQRIPRLIIPATAVRTLFGLAAATYPVADQTTTYNFNSGVPAITDVTSLNLLCDLVDSRGFTLSPQVLATFNMSNGQTPGSLITVAPSNVDWCPVVQGVTFQQVNLRLVDQLMRPVTINDPSGFVAILQLRRQR